MDDATKRFQIVETQKSQLFNGLLQAKIGEQSLAAAQQTAQVNADAKKHSDELVATAARDRLEFDKFRFQQDSAQKQETNRAQIELGWAQFNENRRLNRKQEALDEARAYFAMQGQNPGGNPLVVARTPGSVANARVLSSIGRTPNGTGQKVASNTADRTPTSTASTPGTTRTGTTVSSRASSALYAALTDTAGPKRAGIKMLRPKKVAATARRFGRRGGLTLNFKIEDTERSVLNAIRSVMNPIARGSSRLRSNLSIDTQESTSPTDLGKFTESSINNSGSFIDYRNQNVPSGPVRTSRREVLVYPKSYNEPTH